MVPKQSSSRSSLVTKREAGGVTGRSVSPRSPRNHTDTRGDDNARLPDSVMVAPRGAYRPARCGKRRPRDAGACSATPGPAVSADAQADGVLRSQVAWRPKVVERTLSWLNRFRRLKMRYERRAEIHQAFLDLGCALICWRYVQRFC